MQQNEEVTSRHHEDVDGFSKLLVMIETECGTGGAFAADPRSRELLEVALRLKHEAQTLENGHAIQMLPSIKVRR
ncbi:MAG: hypothetical protein U0936_00045 [Planctomycetaceae bacterium]